MIRMVIVIFPLMPIPDDDEEMDGESSIDVMAGDEDAEGDRPADVQKADEEFFAKRISPSVLDPTLRFH
jgi:hypothetical protein